MAPAAVDLPFLKKGAKVNLRVIKGQIQIRHDLRVDIILNSTEIFEDMTKVKTPSEINLGMYL